MKSTPSFSPTINKQNSKQIFHLTYATKNVYRRLHHNITPLKVERIGPCIQRRQASTSLGRTRVRLLTSRRGEKTKLAAPLTDRGKASPMSSAGSSLGFIQNEYSKLLNNHLPYAFGSFSCSISNDRFSYSYPNLGVS